MGEAYWTAVTLYFHNKIAAVDTDKKVSNTINYKINDAVRGAANKYEYYGDHKYVFNLARDTLMGDLFDLEFPSMNDRPTQSEL